MIRLSLIAAAALLAAAALTRAQDITDCQGQESPDTDVLWTTAGRGIPVSGPPTYTVSIPSEAPFVIWMDKPTAGGTGKFVVQMNKGWPDASTITPLPANLGDACFTFLCNPGTGRNLIEFWNAIGKGHKVGYTGNYADTGDTCQPDPSADPCAFNTNPIPPRAPDWFASFFPDTFAPGCRVTIQGIIANPNAPYSKGFSLTNAIAIEFD